MNFEDIVDMEWVDTHTTVEDPNTFSSEFYFDHQPDFLLDQPPLTPPQQPVTMEPEIKMEPITTMPTTEQIKQLIEIAKRQLALREQNYNQQLQLQQQQSQSQSQNQAQQPAENQLFQPLVNPTAATPTTTSAETQMDAAPSSFFSIPPIPALSPTTVATSEITAAENATTLETIAKQMNSGSNSAMNMNTTMNNTESLSSASNENSKRRDSLASMPDEAISLEAYAEADGIDLKKLTPKERRQLRNKLSARNFRVRRKEYISTLEGQVNDHKKAAEALKEKLVKVEEENKILRKEMDTLKRQNQILLAQKSASASASSSNSSSSSSSSNSGSSLTSSPRLQKPNLNKDLSILGTKATDSYRQQDSFILVSNAIMPVWDYNTILKPKQQPKNDYLNHLVGQFLLSVVQLASSMPRRTNQIEEDEYRLPLMPDDRDFSSSSTTIKSNISSNNLIASTSSSSNLSSTYITSNPTTTTTTTSTFTTSSSLSYMQDLYDVLIQSALINNSNTDKSFWWWDNNNVTF